jgi:hypothetical protein
MKPKQSWRDFKKRIYAVDENTPQKEIANLILMGCNRIRSGDKAPTGYSGKWDYVIMHIARRWNGSKR